MANRVSETANQRQDIGNFATGIGRACECEEENIKTYR